MACLVSCLLVLVVQLKFSGGTCLLNDFFKVCVKKCELVGDIKIISKFCCEYPLCVMKLETEL